MDSLPSARFAQFCYRDYRVTGDSEHKEGPRHPLVVCKACFKGYVEREMDSAKLFVKCLCCPRALQTRELRCDDAALNRIQIYVHASTLPFGSCLLGL